MEYRRFGNTIVARIDKEEDVLEKMKRIAMLEDVKLASVSALGTFSSMTVGIYDLEKRQFMGNDFEGMFEIVSFTGTINTMDGKYYSHIHAAAADAKGNVYGGHLSRGIIGATCEMVITVIDGVVDRVKDRFPSVRDHKIRSVRLRKAHLDVLDDVLVFLKTRIVGCNDAEIRHLSTDLPH